MTKLTDTQTILLSAAAQRADGNLLPLPGSLRGGATGKVVTALLTRGLVREVVADRITRADAPMNTVWRNEEDGRAVLLRITPGGEAIDVELRPGPEPVGAAAATAGLGAAAAETPGRGRVRKGKPRSAAGRAVQTRPGTRHCGAALRASPRAAAGPARGQSRSS
jgi:hypothetical protein